MLGVQIAISQFQIIFLFFLVSYSENCCSFNGELLSCLRLKIKSESETKGMPKIQIKWITLRDSALTVETVRTTANKRDKAIHCFKTTKLHLKGA